MALNKEQNGVFAQFDLITCIFLKFFSLYHFVYKQHDRFTRKCVYYQRRIYHTLTLHSTMANFNNRGKKSFENIASKGENAGGNQHFLLSPQCFLV